MFIFIVLFFLIISAKRQKTHGNQLGDSSDDDDAPLATIVRERRQNEQDQTDEVAEQLVKQEAHIKQLKQMIKQQSLAMERGREEARRERLRHERDLHEIRQEQELMHERQTEIFQRQHRQTTEAMANIVSMVENIQRVINGKVDRRAERHRQREEEETRPDQRQPNQQPQRRPPLPRIDHPRANLNLRDGKVCVAIGHEDINPGDVYPEVEIPADEYDTIRGRCRTVTAFVRSLIGYFFTVDVLRKSNFAGTTVVTKDGQVKKHQLDRRLVLSMLDHAELEFPGEVRGVHFAKLRDVINDKCRHA